MSNPSQSNCDLRSVLLNRIHILFTCTWNISPIYTKSWVIKQIFTSLKELKPYIVCMLLDN